MCGVVGFVSWKKENLIGALDTCRTMTRALAHRGNDGEGFFVAASERCFLGHRRLSILDTSSAGNQPMTRWHNRYTIAYNGEIYNFLELKKELLNSGVTFTSGSDTEVLLYGYALWQEKVFKKLRGMFAGALWDEQEQKILLFRDHIGIKPLYWWSNDTHIAFASELTALRKHPLIETTINNEAVNEYFVSGSIHAPKTIFENIHALEPGHYIECSAEQIQKIKYWTLASCSTNVENTTIQEVITKTHTLLRDAIKYHMIADIPVGAFLSGGLDSSTIVALMKEQTTHKINTFSIGFDHNGKDIDESNEAARIATYFGTNHHHIICTQKTFAESLKLFIQHLDQPSTDGFNSLLVSQAAAQHVHVALSGLGGDELFLGYRYHQELAQFLPLKKSLFFPAVSSIAACIAQSSFLKKIVYHSPYRGFERLADAFSIKGYFNARNAPFKERLLDNTTEKFYKEIEELFNQEKDLLNAYSKAELAWYTPGTLLRDADVTGMAFTLEVRFPFLDIPLIEYLLSLPSHYKIGAHQAPKKLLRSIAETLMPSNLISSTKKGFEMPIGYWLKHHISLQHSLEESKLYDQKVIDYHIKKIGKQPENYLPLWQAFIFTEWLKHNGLTYGAP